MPANPRSVTELMQQADRLLDTLAELPLPQRGQQLDALQQADPELALMLRRLLVAWDRGGPTELGTGAAARALPLPPLSAGTRFGAFAVVCLLGQGGMGEVYLAERADGQFVQQVAIKRILDGGFMQPQRAAEYLARERGLLARLQHPGIATLIDGGIDADGYPWLAMEYIQGRPLSAFVEAQRPKLAQRFDLLLQLVDAVIHAHRALIVHGDLKPANLLVHADGRLRVLDFGIARLLDEPGANASPATPGWASPEQSQGERIGIASDQYQIGRLALLLLAGNSQAPASGERISLRRRAETAGLDHAAALDSALDSVLDKALAAAPDQRYPDLAALRADLLAWRDRRPIAARAGQLRWRALSLLRRHPLSISLVMLLLTASLGFLWALQQHNVALAQARDSAAAEAERATRALDRRGRMLGFVERVFSLADPIGEGGQIKDIDTLLAAAADEVDLQFPKDADLRHEARAMLGIVALRRDAKPLAEAIAQNAAADASPSPGSMASAQAAALRAEVVRSRGDHAAAAESYAQALVELQDTHEEALRWRLFLLVSQLDSLRLSGQEQRARARISEILALSQRSGASAYERSDALSHVALLESDPQRAYQLQREAYETLAQVHAPGQPVMIKRLSNLAGTRMLMGDYAGATQDYAEALRLADAAGRLDTDYHGIAQAVYGRLLTLQGQWQAAQPWLERPLRIYASDNGSPLLSYVEGAWLGWAVERAPVDGLPARVEAWLSIYRGQVGAQHARIREGALLQARLLRRMGAFDQASARLAAIEETAWAPVAARDEALFSERLQVERAGLMLDQRDTLPDAWPRACAAGAYAAPTEAGVRSENDHSVAELFNPALVSGRSARLDAALCARWSGHGDARAVEVARAALIAIAGEDYWLLQRR